MQDNLTYSYTFAKEEEVDSFPTRTKHNNSKIISWHQRYSEIKEVRVEEIAQFIEPEIVPEPKRKREKKLSAKIVKQVRKRKPKANQSRKTEKYEEDRSNAKNVFKCEFCDFRYTKGPKVARNHY